MTSTQEDGPTSGHGKGRAWTWLRVALGCGLLIVVLALPSRPPALDGWPLQSVPLEVPVIVAALLLARGRWFWGVLTAAGVFAALVVVLKVADLGTFTAFSRPFNPWLDVVIIRDGWTLLSHTIGRGQALAIVAGAFLASIVAIAGLVYLLAGAARLPDPWRTRIGGLAGALSVIGAAVTVATPRDGPVAASHIAYLGDRITLMRNTAIDLAAFEAELADDPLPDLPEGTMFSALAGRDVYMLFVESYGRTVLSRPDYRSRIAPRLDALQAQLTEAGLTARSGWLTAPTVGGQSWLAHGAVLSGLPTRDQTRYDRMIASDRQSLNALFRQAGWRTIAIMPAITRDWPEGQYYGYDAIYDAHTLGYRGEPFNWVTMPDQYTLSKTHRIVEAAEAPVMAEVALISSHAPWTPVAELVDWDAVGDGRIFNRQATSGPTPREVWAAPERIRSHYVQSVDYALATLGAFIATQDPDAVFLVMGDHQPAHLLTGDGATRDVPVHVIADDPAIVDRLSALAPDPGMRPDPQTPAQPMWSVRETFVAAMSGAVAGTDDGS